MPALLVFLFSCAEVPFIEADTEHLKQKVFEDQADAAAAQAEGRLQTLEPSTL